MSIVDLMFAPFVECLVLVGLHAYLGLHVIRRRVIFVDLALAQIAALGATVGGILGLMHDSPSAVLYSLIFCLIGAAVFTFTRVRHDRIPHEAVIGLVYAITASLAILVVQKTKGAEHLEGILVGSLLWVKWSDIAATAVVYTAIGAFHFFYWRRFLLISDDCEAALRQGVNVKLWDFLFYASFGFVITFSTKVAGVLLVFVFLVAPAILSVMVTERFGRQLLVGWGSGTLVTVLGLYFSYVIDLPSGPTVVAFYGIVLAVAAVGVYVVKSGFSRPALTRAGLGTLGTLAVGAGVLMLGRLLADLGGGAAFHHGHAHMAQVTATAAPEQDAPALPTVGARAAPDGRGRGQGGPGRGMGPGKGRGLWRAELAQLDPAERLERIRDAIEREAPGVTQELVAFLEDEETPPFFCDEARALMQERAGQDFGFSCEAEAQVRQQAFEKMHQWIGRELTDAPPPS